MHVGRVVGRLDASLAAGPNPPCPPVVTEGTGEERRLLFATRRCSSSRTERLPRDSFLTGPFPISDQHRDALQSVAAISPEGRQQQGNGRDGPRVLS